MRAADLARLCRWCLALAGLGGVVGAALFLLSGFAQANSESLPPFDQYLYRADGALADPINVVFRHADPEEAARAVERLLAWPATAGSPMTFRHPAGARATGYQFGVSLGGGSRWHLRIEGAAQDDATGIVLAAAHRDDTVACGHVGRAFDETRDIIAERFAAAGYHVSYVRLGNTATAAHCDGSLTSGDGRAIVIDLEGEDGQQLEAQH